MSPWHLPHWWKRGKVEGIVILHDVLGHWPGQWVTVSMSWQRPKQEAARTPWRQSLRHSFPEHHAMHHPLMTTCAKHQFYLEADNPPPLSGACYVVWKNCFPRGEPLFPIICRWRHFWMTSRTIRVLSGWGHCFRLSDPLQETSWLVNSFLTALLMIKYAEIDIFFSSLASSMFKKWC